MDLGAAIAIGSAMGLVCGLVPLTFGLTRDEKGLAWGGFGACVLAGAMLGLLLAIPMAIVFTVLIRNNSRRSERQAMAYGAVPAGPESPQATGAQMPAAPVASEPPRA
jgi:Zn-dependent protease with chaperone function